MGTLQYSLVRPSLARSDLTTVAPYMFWLMFRNVASDGFVFEDLVNAGVLSKPGCVLASPSWENTATHVTQDYVGNRTRDAATVAIELAAGPLPTSQPLIDYVQFAPTCQKPASGIGHFDRASFLINGTPRSWTDQPDGPALQTLAILRLFAQCFHAVTASTVGIPVPGWLSTAIPWLQNTLGESLEWSVLPVGCPCPDRLQGPLRPQHRHRHGGDLRRRRRHGHQAPRDCGTAARPVGRPGVEVLSPDQRGRSATRHRPHARALSGGRVRRRYR